MAADSFLRLLQFSDGLFPAGGYAHSFGLETLVQSGRVQNERDVCAFLHAYLESSAAPTDAVVVLRARNYALALDLDACLGLDRLLDALKPAAEIREASRQMGRQTLRILRELSRREVASRDVIPSDRFATGTGRSTCPTQQPVIPSDRRESRDLSSAFPVSPIQRPIASACHLASEEGVSTLPAQFAAEPESIEAASRCHSERAQQAAAGRLPSDEESLFSFLGGRSFSSDKKSAPSSGALAPEASIPAFIARFAAEVETGAAPCHHPTVFGLAAALHNWPTRETASAFLYSTSAMIVGASLRLLPLGQLAGQRILAHAGALIAAVSESILDKTEADIWSFTPELEIAAMRHESLDGRLFRS
jgi:urease accessory protein UreF